MLTGRKITLPDGKQSIGLDILQTEGTIEMSPAVYKNVRAVASTGKDGVHAYGILPHDGSEENNR